MTIVALAAIWGSSGSASLVERGVPVATPRDARYA